MEEYVVDKNLCIDCNACYTSYPEVFKQIDWEGETKADSFAPIEKGKLDPWEVLGCCPTDAITKIGEMPPKPEAAAEEAIPDLEDLGPWEERWARVKNQQETKWEVMKRYGMAAIFEEEKDKYIIKMQFPEKAPHHIKTYQMGLPDTMPDYKYVVELNDSHNQLTINGYLTDPHFKQLTGKINSFPDRFRRVFKLPKKVDITRQSYRGKILVVEMKKIPEEATN